MVQIDSNTVTIVIAISALISPILTTFINNKHQLSVKKMELYEISKRKALEDFIKSCSSCWYAQISPHDKENFYTCLNNLYLYFDTVPSSASHLIEKFGEEFFVELNNVTQELSKQVKKS